MTAREYERLMFSVLFLRQLEHAVGRQAPDHGECLICLDQFEKDQMVAALQHFLLCCRLTRRLHHALPEHQQQAAGDQCSPVIRAHAALFRASSFFAGVHATVWPHVSQRLRLQVGGF